MYIAGVSPQHCTSDLEFYTQLFCAESLNMSEVFPAKHHKQRIEDNRSMLCLNSSSGLPFLVSIIALHCTRLLSTMDASISLIATRASSCTTAALAISLAWACNNDVMFRSSLANTKKTFCCKYLIYMQKITLAHSQANLLQTVRFPLSRRHHIVILPSLLSNCQTAQTCSGTEKLTCAIRMSDSNILTVVLAASRQLLCLCIW